MRNISFLGLVGIVAYISTHYGLTIPYSLEILHIIGAGAAVGGSLVATHIVVPGSKTKTNRRLLTLAVIAVVGLIVAAVLYLLALDRNWTGVVAAISYCVLYGIMYCALGFLIGAAEMKIAEEMKQKGKQ